MTSGLSEADLKWLEEQRRKRQQSQQPSVGFQQASAPPAAPAQEEEDDDGGGGFLGGIADRIGDVGEAAASGFRAVVPEEVRDVAGGAVQTFLSGERTLNAVGSVVGNDDLGEDIGETLEDVPVVGGALRVGFDVAAAPATWATAGFGGGAAAGLSRLGAGGRLAARVVEPVTRGSFAQRAAAETALGTGAAVAGGEVAERLPEETPGAVRLGLTLGAGALGGTTALRALGSAAPGIVGRSAAHTDRLAPRVITLTEGSEGVARPAVRVPDVKSRYVKELAASEFNGIEWPSTTPSVRNNLQALDSAATGRSLSLTGFRQETGPPFPGTGRFYAVEPSHAGMYEIGRRFAPGSELPPLHLGGSQETLSVHDLRFNNPLVVEGGHGALVERLGDERLSALYAVVQKSNTGEEWAALDRAVAERVAAEGYDAIVYRRPSEVLNQRTTLNESEVVDLRPRDTAPSVETTRLRAPDVIVNERTVLSKEQLKALTADARLGEVVGARSFDDVKHNVSAMMEFKRTYAQRPGLLGGIARRVIPKDPDAQAIISEGLRREEAFNSWAAARMAKVEYALQGKAKDGQKVFEFDREGRVTNVRKQGNRYVLTPEQRAAVKEITDVLDELREFEQAAGVEIPEITGRALDELPDDLDLPDQPMFGDLVERQGAGRGHYFPREATEVGGVQLVRQRLDPARPRTPGWGEGGEYIQTMEENIQRGVRYEGNVRQVLQDRLTAGMRRTNRKWIEQASEKFSKTPNDYYSQHAPGLREQSLRLSQQIRNRRESLLRRVARKAEQGRAKRRQELSALRARATARRLNPAQREQLEILERAERVTAQVRPGLARTTRAIESDAQDAFVRISDSRRDMAELQRLADDAAEAKLLTEGEIAEIRDDLARLKEQQQGVRDKLKFHRDRAARPPAGFGAIPQLGGTRFFPQEFADTLSASLRRDDARGITGQITSFNNLARSFMATLDLSAAGIQGLLTLGAHPIMAGRAIATATGATLFNDNFYYSWVHKKSGAIDQFTRLGGHFAASDDAGEFLFSSAARRTPVLGGLFGKANLAFSRTGNMLRTEMFENALEANRLKSGFGGGTLARSVSEAEQRRVVSLINSATGFHSGKPATWEQLSLFAPRYFRSQLDVVQRAFLRGGQDANLARLLMMRTLALGTVLTITVNEARGHETEFNPLRADGEGNLTWNSNFLRMKDIGGADVSVFGGWDSLAALFTTTATAGPIEGAKDLFRTKASPALGTVWDIASGETFDGTPIDITTPDGLMMAVIEETANKMPFTAQDALRDIAAGEPSAKPFFNFFGVKASPTTPFEERDQLAVQEYGRHWADLTGKEREAIEALRPEVFEQIRERDVQRAEQGDARAQARLQREAVDTQRLDGERALAAALRNRQIDPATFDEHMQQLMLVAAVQKETIDKTLGLTYQDADPEKEPNAWALNAWYAIPDQAKIPGTDVMDWELKEALEHDLLSSLNEEQRRFVEERARPQHAMEIPEVAAYFSNKALLSESGYYDTYDAAFAQVRAAVQQIDPTIQSYNDLLARLDNARIAGDEPLVRRLDEMRALVSRTSSQQRELMRFAMPDLDRALLELGRVHSLITEREDAGGTARGGLRGGTSGGAQGGARGGL